jgi:hypothetical protein
MTWMQVKATFLVFAHISILSFWCTALSAQQSVQCVDLSRGGRAVHFRGEFARNAYVRSYCVSAGRGQRMRVTIVPRTPELHTQGNVRFPNGDLAPGAPGGVILDEQVTQSGEYHIRVGQRFNEKKTGEFEVIVELH